MFRPFARFIVEILLVMAVFMVKGVLLPLALTFFSQPVSMASILSILVIFELKGIETVTFYRFDSQPDLKKIPNPESLSLT